uniref:Uncharacterized protein n=1 Tax=Rhizophora mucronata TaxID=61149 RepID=A0A2P2NJ73_RHIMU
MKFKRMFRYVSYRHCDFSVLLCCGHLLLAGIRFELKCLLASPQLSLHAIGPLLHI